GMPMIALANGARTHSRPARVGDVVADAEFADFLPRPSRSEREAIKISVLNGGCREPLLVWPREGKLILVTGYDVFPRLREYQLPFQIIERAFGSRDEVRMYMIRAYLAGLTQVPWPRASSAEC